MYVQLDLGSGAKKVRASKYELNDSEWHRVELVLRKRNGRISIDGASDAFETPGIITILNAVILVFSINCDVKMYFDYNESFAEKKLSRHSSLGFDFMDWKDQ